MRKKSLSMVALLIVMFLFTGLSWADTVENTPPVAGADSYTMQQDTTLNVDVSSGVLANDTDADNDSLTAVVVSGPSNGTVVLDVYGSFTYTPNKGYSGEDSFTYKANDGKADSEAAAVTITVNPAPTGDGSGSAPVNTPPAAKGDSYTASQDTALNVDALSGVLANDTDADNDSLTAAVVSDPGNGTLVLNADGSFTYTPKAGYSGEDTFAYKANDGKADSEAATVTITVSPAGSSGSAPVNSVPVANTDSYTTSQDTALNIDASSGVLANDADADNDSLTAAEAGGPSNGTLVLNADGSFTYTPSTGYSGEDTFTYKANDGKADSEAATVTITVNPATTSGNSGSAPVTAPMLAAGALNEANTETDGPKVVSIYPADGSGSVIDDGSGSVTDYVYGRVPCDAKVKVTFDRPIVINCDSTAGDDGVLKVNPNFIGMYRYSNSRYIDCDVKVDPLNPNVLDFNNAVLPKDDIFEVHIAPWAVREANPAKTGDIVPNPDMYFFTFLTQAPDAVSIPDKNLKEKLRSVCGKASTRTTNSVGGPIPQGFKYPGQEIFPEDLQYMDPATKTTPRTELNLTSGHYYTSPIEELTGLEEATNLTSLNLGYLSNSGLNCNALKGLTKLETLDLSENNISDISFLSGLINLKELNLFNNPVSDLSPLATLDNLQNLYLESTGVTDVSGLKNLNNLEILDLSGNIIDLATFTGNNLTSLKTLDLSRDLYSMRGTSPSLEDLSPLANLSGLTKLDLNQNLIGDISPLKGMTDLTSLGLKGTKLITDISPLSGMSNLTDLDLADNQIQDISALSGLTDLVSINLSKNRIHDLSSLVTNCQQNTGRTWEGVDVSYNLLNTDEEAANSNFDQISAIEQQVQRINYGYQFLYGTWELPVAYVPEDRAIGCSSSTQDIELAFPYEAVLVNRDCIKVYLNGVLLPSERYTIQENNVFFDISLGKYECGGCLLIHLKDPLAPGTTVTVITSTGCAAYARAECR